MIARANFCTTLLLFYHTSDWLNQQNLPKLQVPVYLFIFRHVFLVSLIFLLKIYIIEKMKKSKPCITP